MKIGTRKDVARSIGVSVRTMHRWEADGYGPTPVRIGCMVRYDMDEVEQWFSDLKSRRQAESESAASS